MARLHEYQGKKLLREAGVATPDGDVARSSNEARAIAERLGAGSGGRVVLKVQAWTTGRAAQGGVVFANSPQEAEDWAGDLLLKQFGNFPVSEILVERAIDIAHEIFVSLSIDDAARAPVLLVDPHGGSGIEERAASVTRIAVRADGSFDEETLRRILIESPVEQSAHDEIVMTIKAIILLARKIEARSFEVNPLVVTKDGHPARIVAADCRVTIDDYAVFRHPELGIEIARELDHPPTELERIAYAVEEADHRGTFYFAHLHSPTGHDARLIGFHGAGGGGSMMSMDAVTNVSGAGFTLANFCDTSGNPSAAKVYRAARIILSQPGLVGYFGSGSGVASQEQYWSAYGLAKAFNEVNLNIPAVIRLGGNSEDRAVEILEDACHRLPATVEGYRKDDTPQYCAERFAKLIAISANTTPEIPGRIRDRVVPGFVGSVDAYSFPIAGGTVWIDHESCDDETTDLIIRNGFGLLTKNDQGKPVLAAPEGDVAGKDSEMIACEVECLRAGKRAVFVDLEIRGLDARAKPQA